MKCVILNLLVGAGVFSPVTQAALPENSHLKLGLYLYGNAADSVEAESRIAGTEIDIGFQHTLGPQFRAQVAGGFQIETGAFRARYAQDFQPRQIQRLREAQISWTPRRELTLIAGAMDQQLWDTPLLVRKQTFPAVFEKLQKQVGAWTFSLAAQQAVAADTSTMQPWGNWPKGFPAFYLERLSIDYQPSPSFKAQLHASHFLFDNLSGPVAFQAQFLGNTITGITPSNSQYVYAFQGYELGTQWSGQWRRLRPELGISWIHNSSAPAGKSDGCRAAATVGWELSPTFRLSPQAEAFWVDSDVAPAFYNDRIFGHNNRMGVGFALVADWPTEGIQALARWIHSDVLVSHPYQTNLEWIQLQFRTTYDVF